MVAATNNALPTSIYGDFSANIWSRAHGNLRDVLSASRFVARGRLGLALALFSSVALLGWMAYSASATTTATRSVHLRLPVFNEGRFYEVKLSGKLRRHAHPSTADIHVRVANLGDLPANVRAAYEQAPPRSLHGAWTDEFLIAVNYPAVLGRRAAAAENVDALDLIFKVYAGGSGNFHALDEAVSCGKKLDRFRTALLGPWASSPAHVFEETKLHCKPSG